MKRFLSGMLSVVVFCASAMDDSEKNLIFELGIRVLRSEDWETIDDRDAISLCLIDKKWRTELDPELKAHRNNKIAKLYAWMGEIVTDPFGSGLFCSAYVKSNQYTVTKGCEKGYCNDEYGHCSLPMLALYKDNIVKTVWTRNVATRYFTGLPYWCFDNESALSYILHNSLIIGPSGNTMYGLMTPPRKIESATVPYLQRVRFKLYNDGSIKASDMKIIDDKVCEDLTRSVGIDCSLVCATDQDKKRFIATIFLQLKKDEDKKENLFRFKVLIGNATQKSYSYNNLIFASKLVGIGNKRIFDKRGITQHVWMSCEKEGFLLDYRFDNQTKAISCYEHVAAVDIDNPSPEKIVSIGQLQHGLGDYLLECPAKPIRGFNDRITPAAQRIMHYFVPNKRWPQEIFTSFASFVWRKSHDQNVGLDDINALSRHTQISILRGHAADYDLMMCTLQRRTEDAFLYCDVNGSLYYDCGDGSKPKLLSWRGDVGIDTSFYTQKKWVRLILPQDELLPENCRQYLWEHPYEALQVSAQEFLALFTKKAAEYAQRTWDNKKIGAYWKFDDDGMRIHLYDFHRNADHKIGTYLIPYQIGDYGINRESIVTHVEYEPDTEPLFYSDGKQVDF